MIRSVEIKRIRGIREGKLDDLSPLTVLVGPNGSGKSAILDALLIGASPDPGDAIGRAVRRRQGVPQGARWLFWRAGEQAPSVINLATDVGSSRRSTVMLRASKPNSPMTIRDEILDTSKNKATFSGLVETTFAPDNTYDFTPARGNRLGIPDVRMIDARANELLAPLHEPYTTAVEQGRRDEAQALVAAVVPSMTRIEILAATDLPVVHIVFADHSVPVNLAGDGVLSLVRFALELASFRDGVVLLEEPEVHQHPRAMRQTARAILAAVRRGIQVILTTHSLEFIDSLLGEINGEDELEKLCVYRVQLEDGEFKSCRHPGTEVAFVRNTIEDDLR